MSLPDAICFRPESSANKRLTNAFPRTSGLPVIQTRSAQPVMAFQPASEMQNYCGNLSPNIMFLQGLVQVTAAFHHLQRHYFDVFSIGDE